MRLYLEGNAVRDGVRAAVLSDAEGLLIGFRPGPPPLPDDLFNDQHASNNLFNDEPGSVEQSVQR